MNNKSFTYWVFKKDANIKFEIFPVIMPVFHKKTNILISPSHTNTHTYMHIHTNALFTEARITNKSHKYLPIDGFF